MNKAESYMDLGSSRRAVAGGLLSRDVVVRHRNLIRLALMSGAAVADVGIIVLAAIIGALIRQGGLETGNWIQSVGIMAPAYCLAAIAFGAYRMKTLRSLPHSLLMSCLALATAVAIGFCAAFALQVGSQISRLETAYTILAAASMLFLTRTVGALMLRHVLAPVIVPSIVVLTDGVAAAQRTGNAMTTTVNVRTIGLAPRLSDPAFFDQVGVIVRDADRVVLAFDDLDERRHWMEAMRLSGHDAEIIADLGVVKPIALSHWHDHATLVISRGPLNIVERLTKRAFDLTVTLMLLPILGPIIALFALWVRLDSPGPAFFIQDRVGRNNRTYRCFKLRSMRTEQLDQAGGVSTSRDDRRITRLGKFLRRSSIDELPQLINVLLGDMSLVGPRPHALGSRAEGALFWELVPDYWSRHSMKPGVTGLAQVRGLRGATHRRSDIEKRVAADLEYINGWSLWLDIKILIMTVKVMVHRNAY